MAATLPTITGLDIGSAQVTAITAEVDEGVCKIVGIGRAPSNGLRRGVIVHLDRTTNAIRRALEEAELMAGVPPGPIHVNIAGDHIKSVNSRGVVAVSRRGGPIGTSDVERVLQAARAVPVPSDREVVHVLPSEYVVDDQGGIKNPVGMVGSRLEVEVHIVTAAALAVNNIHHCVQEAGYAIESLTLSTLATGAAVLSDRDIDMGVGLIDVGAGLTDIALFIDGSVRHTATVPLGGRNVTNDLAIGLRTPIDAAEEIKLRYGSAAVESVRETGVIQVPGVGDQRAREVSPHVVASIIGPRVEEIFMMAKTELQKAPINDLLACGLVLTGGGACIPGVADLAERILDLPVRVGKPSDIAGTIGLVVQPADAAAVGLVLHANDAAPVRRRARQQDGVLRRVSAKIGQVLSEFI